MLVRNPFPQQVPGGCEEALCVAFSVTIVLITNYFLDHSHVRRLRNEMRPEQEFDLT